MGNKKNKTNRLGIWIKLEIINDKNLDWPNKALLAEIYSLCELENGCYASDSYFGKLIGFGRAAINKRINWLREQGYISTKNQYKSNLCVGRKITIGGSSDQKHIIVPIDDRGSSHGRQGVVPVEDRGSSDENTINTTTKTDIIIQEKIPYTGASMNQVLKNRYEELVVKLVDSSSLGEGIFYYTEPENLSMYRDAVNEKEYKMVYPILVNVIDISRKLYGN